jgi:hypothetical protein
MMTGTLALTTDEVDATTAWSRRVRRVGGFIQVAFAAFWLIRGSLTIRGTIGASLALAFTAVVLGVVAYGVRVTAGKAPRPTTPEGTRIERAITVATIAQLVASFAVPAAVIAAGYPDWVLPTIAITIGPLLIWLDRRVKVPRYRPVGWALIVGPLALGLTMSGRSLGATTGIAAGVLLLGTAALGFHDLAGDEVFGMRRDLRVASAPT